MQVYASVRLCVCVCVMLCLWLYPITKTEILVHFEKPKSFYELSRKDKFMSITMLLILINMNLTVL